MTSKIWEVLDDNKVIYLLKLGKSGWKGNFTIFFWGGGGGIFKTKKMVNNKNR